MATFVRTTISIVRNVYFAADVFFSFDVTSVMYVVVLHSECEKPTKRFIRQFRSKNRLGSYYDGWEKTRQGVRSKRRTTSNAKCKGGRINGIGRKSSCYTRTYRSYFRGIPQVDIKEIIESLHLFDRPHTIGVFDEETYDRQLVNFEEYMRTPDDLEPLFTLTS